MALVLPGGGALGAYQVGVYQAMDELGVRPDWVAGVSIGALNGAVIAGNPPEQRVDRLQEFWRSISQPSYWPSLLGNPGFFRPRLFGPWLAPRGTDSALSFYDTLPIRRALERFVDFDHIRAGETRLSLGAVNVRTGQVRYFDSTRDAIGVEHVLASLALPPAFPPVEIEGELYWDGGVVSNTPLDTVLEDSSRFDTLCVMVDLLSAEGAQPSGMDEVLGRIKDIGFASRTDTSLAHFHEKHQMRRAIGALIDELPDQARRRPEVKALAQLGSASTMTIVRLAHQAQGLQLSQEYDFSELSVEDRRRAGYEDAVAGYARLRRGETRSAMSTPTGVSIYDFNAASPELEEQPARPVEAA